MIFSVKEYLTFSTLLAAFTATAYGQHYKVGNDGQQNDISEDDSKYPYQPYGFGYDIEDGYGNKQWRHEKSQQADNVIGSYGFKDKDGIMREVEYVADKNGFRARIKTNEPGTAPKDSGDTHWEAQPVMVSNYAKQDSSSGSGQQDYQPNSSKLHRIQHRMGKYGRNSRMGWSASRPVYNTVPYYS